MKLSPKEEIAQEIGRRPGHTSRQDAAFNVILYDEFVDAIFRQMQRSNSFQVIAKTQAAQAAQAA